MTERVLTVRELNRAVLARQLLLERSRLPLERAVAQVACLQTQYAPSGYVGLFSRLAGFRRPALTEALLERRIVQAWMMRCTIHMVSAEDYWPLTEAVRESRRRMWRPPAGVDMPAVAEAVRTYLTAGARKQQELVARLVAEGYPREVWAGLQLWLDLVRVPPAGTWERPRAHVYGLAEEWLPARPRGTAEQGAELLARRYLGGFGPASAHDVATFCGWTVTEARAVLSRVELRRFRDEAGRELVDLPEAPLPPPDTPAPVRFLGQWDATLLVHTRRAQILPEVHRPNVFATSMPQSTPTFLVDGQVAGTWRAVDRRVSWQPFSALPPAVAREVDAEADRLSLELL